MSANSYIHFLSFVGILIGLVILNANILVENLSCPMFNPCNPYARLNFAMMLLGLAADLMCGAHFFYMPQLVGMQPPLDQEESGTGKTTGRKLLCNAGTLGGGKGKGVMMMQPLAVPAVHPSNNDPVV
jgi:hypothetical protein